MAAMRPTLFDNLDAPDPELLAFIVDGLVAGPRSLDGIRDYLLRETARWLPRHALGAVKYLIEEGRLRQSPETGRLTKASLLELLAQPAISGI